MRSIGLTFGLLLGALPATTHAQPESAGSEPVTLEAVSERLASFETVRGEFVQVREIEGLARPLEAQGRFIVSKLGLYWEQTEPFESRLIARENSLTQQAAGRESTTITAEERPMAVSISRVFLGLFQGDRSRLDEHFDMEFSADGDAWQLQLDAQAYPLNEAVDVIVIEGHRHLERLRIEGAAGDVLSIQLSSQRTEPAALTEAERALYTR